MSLTMYIKLNEQEIRVSKKASHCCGPCFPVGLFFLDLWFIYLFWLFFDSWTQLTAAYIQGSASTRIYLHKSLCSLEVRFIHVTVTCYSFTLFLSFLLCSLGASGFRLVPWWWPCESSSASSLTFVIHSPILQVWMIVISNDTGNMCGCTVPELHIDFEIGMESVLIACSTPTTPHICHEIDNQKYNENLL